MRNTITGFAAIWILAFFFAAPQAYGAMVYADSFDDSSELINEWTAGSGEISTIAGRTALRFSEVTVAGDIWSKQMFSPGSYTLRFDYYGGPVPDILTEGGLGGFIGVSTEQVKGTLLNPVGHAWLAGTLKRKVIEEFGGLIEISYSPVYLIDNAEWSSYLVNFSIQNPFYLMLEDCSYGASSGTGIPNDAYFDNVMLVQTPLPGAVWLLLTGMALLPVFRGKKVFN